MLQKCCPCHACENDVNGMLFSKRKRIMRIVQWTNQVTRATVDFDW